MRTLLCSLIIFSIFYAPKATTTHFTKNEVITKNHALLSKMIREIQPNLSEKKAYTLAKKIYTHSSNFNLDPKILIAILYIESNFRNNVTSKTGDYSMAQINVDIWNREFTRLGMSKLDKHLLKYNENYVIYKMAKILSILDQRKLKHDKNWYANYHSMTPKLKNIYAKKINSKINKIRLVTL